MHGCTESVEPLACIRHACMHVADVCKFDADLKVQRWICSARAAAGGQLHGAKGRPHQVAKGKAVQLQPSRCPGEVPQLTPEGPQGTPVQSMCILAV